MHMAAESKFLGDRLTAGLCILLQSQLTRGRDPWNMPANGVPASIKPAHCMSPYVRQPLCQAAPQMQNLSVHSILPGVILAGSHLP